MDGEVWVDSGFIFRNSASAYHVAVVYDYLPDEIKDLKEVKDIDTTYEIADPTLKFVCGNCRNARFKGANKGIDSKIGCCVWPNKKITPKTKACVDIKDEFSVFNTSFNPIGKGGHDSGYYGNDPNNRVKERLVE